MARAVSPFAIELDWDDRSDNEYGFEVEERTNEGSSRAWRWSTRTGPASTFQLVNGTYVEVDRFMGCSFEGALAESRPPFRAECYEDEPCQQPLGAE